jgi:3-methyladenine DNA glycosylase/8-oxoguanine DNA glycosylase
VGHRAIAGLETVTDDCYRRNGISVRQNPRENCLVARIESQNMSRLRQVVEQIRFFFDLRANASEIAVHLRKSPGLRGVVAGSGGLRLPGWRCAGFLGNRLPFEARVLLTARLVEQFGKLNAGKLADADLMRVGVPGGRAESLRGLARAPRAGRLSCFRSGLIEAAGVSSPRRLEVMAEAWRPWRSYAALYLWESLNGNR